MQGDVPLAQLRASGAVAGDITGEELVQPLTARRFLPERVSIGERIRFPRERFTGTSALGGDTLEVILPLLAGFQVAHGHAAADIDEFCGLAQCA